MFMVDSFGKWTLRNGSASFVTYESFIVFVE